MSKVELIRKYPYKIRTYQVDNSGKIALHHLFNLFQDVAHRDALQFGFAHPQMLEQERLWVLSRISVKMKNLPRYDDEVEMLTWVKSVNGSRSEREFAMLFNGDRVITATSLWFCLSSLNHRPADIPMEEKLQRLIHNEYSLEGGAQKVGITDDALQWQGKNSFEARYSDVDMVNHVNNASYVRWVMDESRTIFPNHTLESFTINYLSEVHLGDRIEVRHKEEILSLIHI